MKKLGIIAAAAAALIGGLVAVYWLAFPSYSHRYRLTIEVETPDGLKTGSSVIEARVRTEPHILPNTGAVTSLHGDAVFLDMGNGKNLVALLASGEKAEVTDGLLRLAMKAFEVRRCTGPFCEWKAIEHMSGARDLPPALIPPLVTFANPDDPKTARLTKPEEFEAVFGPGYRFKRAWIEMTNDPVTRTIDKKLPWVEGFKGVTGGAFDTSWKNPGQNLYASHFRR